MQVEMNTKVDELLLLLAMLVADAILTRPDFTKTFVLQTDASDYGLAAFLTLQL